MFALETLIRDELKAVPELSVFQIRTATDLEASKRTVPAIEIVCEGARIDKANAGKAGIAVAWGVHLIVPRGDGAADQLDEAFAAVIGSLLGYAPGTRKGRYWKPLELSGGGSVQVPEFVEQGLAEYAVIFETSAVYSGRKN